MELNLKEEVNLLIVGGNALLRVALVCGILQVQALLARDLQAVDSPEQLSALAGKHGAHDELNPALLRDVFEFALEIIA